MEHWPKSASETKVSCSQKRAENKWLRLCITKFVVFPNAKVDLTFMKGKHHGHFFP